MRRIPLTELTARPTNYIRSKETLITVLLKRACTFEEAMEFVLSAVPEIHIDDMLGELLVWDENKRKLKDERDKKK
jgi:hypothetical protein